MKLTILQEKLKEGLFFVERATAKSLTLPILNTILIKTEKNFLTLTGTDLEIGMSWWFLAKVEKEGEIAVPAHIFSSFVGLLPNKPVDFVIKDKTLTISHEGYQTQIKGLPSEDFPIVPRVSGGENIEVECLPFCQGLSLVTTIATPSTARPEISGVYFLFQKDLITMAATDSFRLGEKKISLEGTGINKDYAFILPQKTAKEIINVFSERKGKLKISFSPNQIMFEVPMAETPHPQIQLVSRLIEGEYPNYQEIIPKKYETQAVLPKNEFLNQIKLASLFSGKTSEVNFKVNPQGQKIEIFSQNPEVGEHQSTLFGKIKGQKGEISFNYRFLVEGLLNIKSSEIIFELNGEEGPGVLKPAGDQTYVYVVMPIKAS